MFQSLQNEVAVAGSAIHTHMCTHAHVHSLTRLPHYAQLPSSGELTLYLCLGSYDLKARCFTNDQQLEVRIN